MKVKDIYQIMVEDWKWVRLGEVAKIATGNSNVQDAVDGGIYPLFDRSGEVKRSDGYFLNKEAVIVPGEGLYFIPKYYKGKFDLHQRAYAIFDFKGLEGKFFYYLMHLLKDQLIKVSVGTTVFSLRLPHFQNLLIPLPPLPEQRKIAEIFETVDNAIEKTDKIIEKYKRIKQGLMQDLLTKGIDENGNIRSEKTHQFKDSPLGRIPEEWEVVKLKELTNQIIDGTHHTPNYTNDGVPFLRVTDIQSSKIDWDTVLKINFNEHKILSKRCKPEYGDILYSKNGTIGISKIVDWMTYNFSIFVSLCLIKPKHAKIFNKFLKYYLDSEYVKRQIEFRIKQLSVANLHLEEIREFLVILPPLPEQQRIASILSQIDETIEKEQEYKEKLERIKKGLMEDLLTGKVRVNNLIKED